VCAQRQEPKKREVETALVFSPSTSAKALPAPNTASAGVANRATSRKSSTKLFRKPSRPIATKNTGERGLSSGQGRVASASEHDMERLKKLKDLYDDGFLTDEEYARRKNEIIDAMMVRH
jgi:hypothetical protein